MPRSVNAVASRRRRKRILKLAKGYIGSRSKVYTIAKNTVEKGLLYDSRDRKTVIREFRAVWRQRINAGAREHGISYSQLIGKLNDKNVGMILKVLADLAMNKPE